MERRLTTILTADVVGYSRMIGSGLRSKIVAATGLVLVQGAWHDHHTWNVVVPRLEIVGHVVAAVDLPEPPPERVSQ